MTDLFTTAVAVILDIEKVHSTDPKDPGGDTWYGLARRYNPEVSPWPPSKEEAVAVYRRKYWDPHRCGEMPWPWALSVFDGEVNQGGTVRLAQQALGLQAQDGVVGPTTLRAMQGADPFCLREFLALRLMKYTRSPQFERDGLGFFDRVIQIAQLGAAPPAAPTAGN